VWNYHDKDDLNVAPTPVTIHLKNINGKIAVMSHYRIDQEHSNSYTYWKRIGSPQTPDAKQYAQLEQAGQLQKLQPDKTLHVNNGDLTIAFQLPRQGISLIRLTLPGK
jgi:xylan 1,4-beta-xylosidase